jgi:Flp pilus assembly protein TadB
MNNGHNGPRLLYVIRPSDPPQPPVTLDQVELAIRGSLNLTRNTRRRARWSVIGSGACLATIFVASALGSEPLMTALAATICGFVLGSSALTYLEAGHGERTLLELQAQLDAISTPAVPA